MLWYKILKPVNTLTFKQIEATDLNFKAENLQQLSTNALPAYTPNSPPSSIDANFEVHCCSDCGDTFAMKSSLNFHLERRSVLIKFPCETCKSVRIFYNRCTLKSHIRTHTDKNEPSSIEMAVVNPLPRVFMDGLQTEFVNILDDELNSMDDSNEMTPTALLEFSLKEDDSSVTLMKEKSAKSSKIKCSDCNEEFESAEGRKEHLTNGEKVPVLASQCNKCGMLCPSKCSLKAHQRLHLQVSPYICPECGESPDAYWINFSHHVKFKCFHFARGIGYKCPICKKVSPNQDTLLKHLEVHTEKYLKCESCPRAYITAVAFDDHIKEFHLGRTAKYATIFKCSLCDIVFLGNEENLAHRSSHMKEQYCEYVFNCMQCGKAMENKVQLLEHIKSTHPKIYQHIVSNDTKKKDTLSAVGYKGKFECILCNCKFNNFQGYSVHLSRSHVNMNQPCNYCFMIIGNRKEMITHGKKHLVKGNVVCLLCNNMKCSDERRLDVHLSKGHTDKLQCGSVCPICTELMPTSFAALNHLRVEHYLIASSTNQMTEKNVSNSENTDAELQEHLKTTHDVDSQTQQNVVLTSDENKESRSKKQRIEENVCAKCNFESSDRETFKKHLLSHKTNKSTFQCQECGLCFVVEPALVKHLRIIHKINDAKKYIENEGTNFMPDCNKTAEVNSCDSLICNVCFTTFETEAQLKTHMRSHGMAFIRANTKVSS
ncbi:zinc finger protein 532 [Caerostris extrusa]|uniref:Zinc finger protein 532 n=1 Tax=Caerostris extrusa TaxID=172846 RepID=A0AAV4WAN8_CAEEX|nr:zinc finger protein 532 [Caerostris extrusa]